MLDKIRLRNFFNELIKLGNIFTSSTPGFGLATSYLCDEMSRRGDWFIQEIIDRSASGNSEEIRLNGAGLKLYISEANTNKPRFVIGGDQAGDYPDFVEIGTKLIINEWGDPWEYERRNNV
jgi:hypothetical protein